MKNIIQFSLVFVFSILLIGCGPFSEDADENTSTDPVITYETTADYVGMSVPNAQAKAKAEETRLRFVEIDSEPQAVTKDFRPGRINAVVNSGVISSYEVEGQE